MGSTVPMLKAAPSGESLMNAFLRFQQQCQLLESTHDDLRHQLADAQSTLARRNRELACRVAEIGAMKERLSGILESITDAVFLIDANGEIEVANPAARHLFEESFQSEMDLSAFPEIQQLIETDESIQDISVSINTPAGQHQIMVSVAKMSKGVSEELVVALKDITEQHQIQERVGREQRLTALGAMAASVAHEIRNPLAAVLGYARLLERDLTDVPASAQQANRIVQAANQMNAVVGNLLNYTRDLVPNSRSCNLNELVAEIVEMLRTGNSDQGIEILVQMDSGLPPADLDPVQIRQVITNLVSNAVDACQGQPGGCVRVETHSTADHVSMLISDNGQGIPKALQSRVFDPFFTTKDGGVGLGLALCRRLVDAHGGTIDFSSLSGAGTVFTVSLPQHSDITTRRRIVQ